jgi:hypothetical protein
MSGIGILTTIYNDNQGSVNWSKGWVANRRMQHVNIQNMALGDARERKEMDIEHSIESELNATKFLPKKMEVLKSSSLFVM